MTETNLTGTTPDITVQNIEALKSLFPEVCSDGKIDFEKLQQLLGKEVDTSPERYNFSWNRKSQALHLSQSPSTGTLIPCKEESRNFDSTQNLYIEGDNLEVLKLLQKPYHKAVKMIYIDPPYNTGSDFVYPDDFKDSLENYLELTGQVDSDGGKMGTNAESNGRYHTDWLNMMYPRLRLARNLLRDDGVIFISIDDHEQANLKKICDEVFGEDNFIAQLIWERAFSPKNDARFVSNSHDYILMYARNINNFIIGRLDRTEEANARYSNPDNDPRGVWMSSDISVKTYTASSDYPITTPSGKVVEPPAGRCWSLSRNAFLERLQDNRIWFGPNQDGTPRIKRFLSELKFDGMAPTSILFYKDVGHSQEGAQEVVSLFGDKGVFDGPKPVRLLQRLITLANLDDDSLVMDFFSGSATTAHAVMKYNSEKKNHCKFILIQLPEPVNEKVKESDFKTICEIGKERIRRAGDKIQKEFEEKLKNASPDLFNQTTKAEPVLDTGFKVFKLASSNIKKWNPDYEHLDESLWQNVNSFVDGRTELDAVYEIMLKLGLELTCPVEEKELAGKKIYSVARGILIICLDKDITTDLAHAIVELQKTTGVQEMRVVFADNGFKDDVAKTNCRAILKQGGIQEFVTI